MNDRTGFEDEEISLVALATLLVRNRWRIARWTVVGLAIAVFTVTGKPLLYVASAAFLPQSGSSSSSSGLSSIAGQFGISVPTGNQGQSPLFYASLLRSRTLLEPIVRDTLVVQELGGRRIAFLDLVGIVGGSVKSREERGVNLLKGAITSAVDEDTGLIEATVTTQWPSVSLAVATALVDGIEEYDRRTKQAQAKSEREFIGERAEVARRDLRAAEDRLAAFASTNRDVERSPQLMLERDRLQRDVTFAEGIFSSLSQSYQDALIRELHDTPAPMIVDQPSVSTTPMPRGRLTRLLLGLLLGSFVGTLLVFASEALARRRADGDVELAELSRVVRDLKGNLFRPRRWLRSRTE